MVDHADIVSRLGEAKVVLAASSARVLLARVKGYPHWPVRLLNLMHRALPSTLGCYPPMHGSDFSPDHSLDMQAQILSDAVAAKKLGKKRRDNDVPVMFFGTNEIALIGKDDCFSWSDGVQKGLLSKGKQKGFIKAIEQASQISSRMLICP